MIKLTYHIDAVYLSFSTTAFCLVVNMADGFSWRVPIMIKLTYHIDAVYLSFSTTAFCLVVNEILFYSHGFLFQFMMVDMHRTQ